MITYEIVESNLNMAHALLKTLVEDLSEDDMLVRPVDGANHIAWQLGHLIGSEYALISEVSAQVDMEIPMNWQEKYSSETAKLDDPGMIEAKDRYLELYDAQRAATLAAFRDMVEDQLSEPAPEFLQRIVPSVGDLFLFLAHHELMHAGQFTCVRRKLGKPVLF